MTTNSSSDDVNRSARNSNSSGEGRDTRPTSGWGTPGGAPPEGGARALSASSIQCGSPAGNYGLNDWFWRTSIFTMVKGWREARAAFRAETAANDELNSLPRPIGELVRAVVRRTRLRRSERADITRELTAHFRDGLESEAPEATLIESFGDARCAAKLLRQSTRAKRSVVDRSFAAALRWGSIACAILVSVYAAAAIRLSVIGPTIAFSPITAINELIPQPDDGVGAWPEYRDALVWMNQWQWPSSSGPRDVVPPWYIVRDLSLVGSEEWNGAREQIQSQRDAIDRLRVAAARPVLGYPLSHTWRSEDRSALFAGPGTSQLEPPLQPSGDERDAYSILLPQLNALRTGAMLLAADAVIAAEGGDGQRAAENLIAIFGVARHASEQGFNISIVVGDVIRMQGADQAVALIETWPEAFDDVALAMLNDCLAQFRESDFDLDLSVERIAFLDRLQRVYTDDGRGDGAILIPALGSYGPTEISSRWAPSASERVNRWIDIAVAPVGSFLVPGRRQLLDRYDEFAGKVERASARPLWEFVMNRAPTPNEYESIFFDESSILFAGLPAYERTVPVRKVTFATIEATRVVIAMARYRLVHGSWPISLEALVPDLLPVVPRDPHDGKLLRYAVREGSPILWSVGGDRVDDGGIPFLNAHEPDRTARRAWDELVYWRSAMQEASESLPGSARPIRVPDHVPGDWIIFDPVGLTTPRSGPAVAPPVKPAAAPRV